MTDDELREQFGRIDQRFDRIDQRFGLLEEKIDQNHSNLVTVVEAQGRAITALDRKIDGLDGRFSALEGKVDSNSSKLDKIINLLESGAQPSRAGGGGSGLPRAARSNSNT